MAWFHTCGWLIKALKLIGVVLPLKHYGTPPINYDWLENRIIIRRYQSWVRWILTELCFRKEKGGSLSPLVFTNGLLYLLKKNRKGRVEDILLWKPPWNFSFFYLNPGNFRQNKVPPMEIPQNCVRCLGNFKAKNQELWEFHIIFPGRPWKFHFVFNQPLEIPLVISLLPLEIPWTCLFCW